MVALTIGMPTYDDFDGVFFTVQALRLYQDLTDTEILVVDNFGCDHTRSFLENCGDPAIRYVRRTEITGTAPAKDRVFREAAGDAVLCCDSHILFAPDAIARLKAWWRDHPGSLDLVQGPLLHDDLISVSTHFDPVWSDEMWGTWGTNPRGLDPDGEPFDIPMQGLGVFSCLRESWPGFNPLFRGFGGEEGYLQEKVRQRGGRALCLPFLRWSHRFGRPNGVPYPLFTEHKFRNYILGHHELGLDPTPVVEHFSHRLAPEGISEQIALVFQDLGEPVPADLQPWLSGLPVRAVMPANASAVELVDEVPPLPEELPLISAVLLTYQRPPDHQWLLEEAIESFLRQDYPNKELVVLNDCGEQELICDQPGVRIFNAPERCETMAEKWNLAVHLAEGQWIAPWSEAVVSLPNRLSASLRHVIAIDGVAVFPEASWVLDEVGLHHERAIGAGISHSLGLYPKVLWHSLDGYQAVTSGEDVAMEQAIRADIGDDRIVSRLPLSEWFAIVREDLPGLASAASPDQATWDAIGHAPIQPGVFWLEPRWHTDYVGLIAAQLGSARG
ncbi:MAG: glycosyltransferase [Thermomicrobiales bacterium]